MTVCACRLWGLCLVSLFVVSCSGLRLRPVRRDLAADTVPTRFAEDGPAVTPGARWWEELGSTELNRLMDEAFQGNLGALGSVLRFAFCVGIANGT